MSNYNNEQISALIDGEHDNDAIIGRLPKDQILKDVWSRYHLIGDCLRDQLPEQIDNDIAARVSQALENEPTVLAPQTSRRFNLKPLAGFAIAASVAMVAVFTVQKGNEIDPVVQPAAIASNNVNSFDQDSSFSPQLLPAAVKKSDTPVDVVNQRLNKYLLNHNEYRRNGNINGILPYVRIVTVEPQEK